MWSLMQMAVFRPCWKPRCWLTHFLMEHGIKIWWRVRASDHLRWNPGPNSWETEQAPNFSRLYFSCLYQPHRSWGVWRFNKIILTVGVRMKWDNACYNALHMLTMDPEEPVVILFFFFQKRVHGVTESASYQHFDLLFRGLGACSKVTGTAGYSSEPHGLSWLYTFLQWWCYAQVEVLKSSPKKRVGKGSYVW